MKTCPALLLSLLASVSTASAALINGQATIDYDQTAWNALASGSGLPPPALVLSDAASFNAPAGHSVMAMITSQANAPWPLDCPIGDLKAAGLPAPSLVRFKLFTLDHRLVRGELGKLAATDAATVRNGLTRLLGDNLR